MKKISTKDLNINPFTAIGTDWMLVTAGNEDKVNTMTASWGGMGAMWDKDVVFIVIRPQRYTKEFVDREQSFSLNFLDDFRKELAYLGATSGRDEDKIAKCKLTPTYYEGIPFFEEAHTNLICKTLYVQPYEEDSFLFPELHDKWYPEDPNGPLKSDLHTLYIAEVIAVIKK